MIFVSLIRFLGQKRQRKVELVTPKLSADDLDFLNGKSKSARLKRMNQHNVNIQVQATYGSKWDVSNVRKTS